MKNNPIEQHYLPKLFSKFWCKLYIKQSLDNKEVNSWKFCPKLPKSTAWVKNLNTLKKDKFLNDDVYIVEKEYSNLETKLAPIIHKLIVQGASISVCNNDEINFLVRYINLLALRNPLGLKQAEIELIKIKDEMLKEKPDQKEILTDELFYNESRILPYFTFKKMNIEDWPYVFVIDSKIELFFSDFPFVGTIDLFILMAINPYKLFVMSKQNMNYLENYKSLCEIYNTVLIKNKKNMSKYLYSIDKIDFEKYKNKIAMLDFTNSDWEKNFAVDLKMSQYV